jgi:WD40 repeat protein
MAAEQREAMSPSLVRGPDHGATVSHTAGRLDTPPGPPPLFARTAVRLERSWRWACRRSVLGTALGLGLVAILALVGVRLGTGYQQRLEENDSRLAATARELERANARLAAARDDLDRLSYLRRVALALNVWHNNEVQRSRKLLDSCPEKYRHWEWHYAHRLCHTGRTLAGHTAEVRSVTFGADDQSVVSAAVRAGGTQTEVKRWDTAGGKLLDSIELSTGPVGPVVLHPDGTRLATADVSSLFQDGPAPVRLWDLATRKQIAQLEGLKGIVGSLAYSPNGKWVAGTSTVHQRPKLGPPGVAPSPAQQGDAMLTIWDTATGAARGTLPFAAAALANVTFSPDSRLVAATGAPGVKVWDTVTGTETAAFPQFTTVQGIAFSPDGSFLALLVGRALRICNVRTRDHLRSIDLPTTFNQVLFTPDGKGVVACSDEGHVLLLHVWSGQVLCTFRGHSAAVACLAVSRDGKRIASGGSDKAVCLWDVAAGREVSLVGPADLFDSLSFGQRLPPLTQAVFGPDGRLLVTASRIDSPASGRLQFWDADTGQLERMVDAHTGAITGIAISRDGKRLASVGTDRTVKVWNCDTWQPAATIAGGPQQVLRVAFGPGRQLAGICPDEQQGLQVRIWDADSGTTIRTIGQGVGLGSAGEFELGIGPRTQLAFSPDGKWLLTAACDKEPHSTLPGVQAAGPLNIWDASTGKLLRSLDGGPKEMLRCLAVSPDGKRVVTARHDPVARSADVKLWDGATGVALPLEHGPGGDEAMLEDIAFSPDGRRIAGATASLIVLWDAVTGQDIITLKSPFTSGRFLSVTFSPDGKRIAAANTLGVVLLWDARSRQWPDDRAP